MAARHAAIPHILSRQADPTLCSHALAKLIKSKKTLGNPAVIA
jgi:hypothetical protein